MKHLLIAIFCCALFATSSTAPAAAQNFIRVSNYTDHDADFVVDGSYTCHAPASRDCVFSTDCSVESDLLICVPTPLSLGSHTVVFKVAGQTFTQTTSLQYDPGLSDEPVVPPYYFAACRAGMDYFTNGTKGYHAKCS